MPTDLDPLPLFRLDGRVAIVTGASSGLGDRFARVLHDSHSTAYLDRGKPQRPIVQRAREHHAHHTPTVGARSAAKQHVH